MDAESILTSIKKLLGIAEDYTQFDVDLIIHINTVLSILGQIGVGDESQQNDKRVGMADTRSHRPNRKRGGKSK